jgi:hypothetical protein
MSSRCGLMILPFVLLASGEPPMVIPRAPPGVRPVLPVAAGPLFVKDSTAAAVQPAAAAAAAGAAAAAAGSGVPSNGGQLA